MYVELLRTAMILKKAPYEVISESKTEKRLINFIINQ